VIEMRGADAYFLWGESRARHMHTVKVVVVDPSTAHVPLTFERVCAGAPSAMALQPAFRRRPLRTPLGVGHPVWLDAPQLEVEHHFRHTRLPPGSGDEALDDLVGTLASEPLDETRPLWELTFVDGLAGGRVAYVVKIHHAAADGLASAELLARSFPTDPAAMLVPPKTTDPNEPVPSPGRLFAYAVRHDVARLRELPSLIQHSLRAIRVGRRWRNEGDASLVRPFASPMTRFNRPLLAERIYAHVTLPLEALRKIKSAFGCTINDVYLALTGGALRRYLEGHGELPDAPLSATIPASARSADDDPTFGNATIFWTATTGSDLADPVERLRAVAKSAHDARALSEARDDRRMIDWYDHWPLRRLYMTAMPSMATAMLHRPSFNVIVSNVRGPSQQLYSDGGRVVAMYSMGPLAAQQGLNFTAWSYLNDFRIGVHACREHVPDVRALADGFLPELAELTQAAERSRGR